ncbi:MAG TPA: NUDIX domain-containing protein [Micropepsaceae bacterium]|nr:NUDIX domain-containing protein [Micropepsaceae bacterium]
MTEKKAEPPVPVPSATIMLLRDGDTGLEVFMVKRHHQIDFASGALVFPGGKLAAGDRDPALRALCDGAEALTDDELALRAGAIREAFEESGILLARSAATGDFVQGAALEALQEFRPKLDKGELGLVPFLKQHDLRLAVDGLSRFAHWVTPTFMPKRFDTHFYVAQAPAGQLGAHDGRESVDSTWITPADAIADPKRWTVIFPTRMNLQKLGEAANTDDAIARARRDRIVTVLPWVDGSGEKPVLRIQKEAGYGDVAEPLDSLR